MEFTGERMVPRGADAVTFWEHVERYRFACRWVKDRAVLDIACGEGYGSAALAAAGARSVIGVDISPDAVEHARIKYGIDARVGSAEEIPLDDASVDVIVSFETIEHVARPAAFLDECKRILRRNGTLIISTPNLDVYRDRAPDNPFHSSEMSLDEFTGILEERFSVAVLYGQCSPAPWFMRTRGLGRLARLGRRIFNPVRNLELTDATRNRAVDLCLSPLSSAGRFFTLDAVRHVSRQALEKSCYVVAVAEKLS